MINQVQTNFVERTSLGGNLFGKWFLEEFVLSRMLLKRGQLIGVLAIEMARITNPRQRGGDAICNRVLFYRRMQFADPDSGSGGNCCSI
jgi:hypothetical protein